MQFPEKLFQLRKKKGLTQAQLAGIINVSRQAISKWEMGTAVPDIANVLALSRVFNVTTDYLLNDKMDTENDSPAVKETVAVFKIKHKYILVRIILVICIVAIIVTVGIVTHSVGQTIIILQIIGTIFLVYHGMRFLKLLLENSFSNRKN